MGEPRKKEVVGGGGLTYGPQNPNPIPSLGKKTMFRDDIRAQWIRALGGGGLGARRRKRHGAQAFELLVKRTRGGADERYKGEKAGRQENFLAQDVLATGEKTNEKREIQVSGGA